MRIYITTEPGRLPVQAEISDAEWSAIISGRAEGGWKEAHLDPLERTIAPPSAEELNRREQIINYAGDAPTLLEGAKRFFGPVERVGEPIRYSFSDCSGSIQFPVGESKDVVIIHGIYLSEEALRQRIGQIGEELIRQARATSDVETLEHSTTEKLAALGRQLEFDRTKLAEGVTAIKKALGSREWLAESRGPYQYDDARYQQEFGAAIKEIREALAPLAKIAADWSSCPRDSESVARARMDLEAKNKDLKEWLFWTLNQLDHYDGPTSIIGCDDYKAAKVKAREALK